MRKRQRGVTLTGLLTAAVILAVLALLGMKIVPEVIEFYNIKKVLARISNEKATTVADVQKAFERYATVDNISAITAKDLEITKENNQIVVYFAYERKIPLFANASLLLEFSGSSKD